MTNNIQSNKDLVQAVNDAIEESGYKKIWVAKQLGMTRQGFSQFLGKKSFSLDDAILILDIIGYKISGLNVSKK